MSLRTIITCLLVLALTATSAARPPVSVQGEDLKITPEEEREARELLEEFNRKFVGTSDIDPLIKDYFVPDFSSRLRHNAGTYPFALIDWKDEAAPPDPEDLRRFYVAAMNLLHDFYPLYAAAAKKCAEEEEKEDAEKGGAKGDGECDDDYEPKMEKLLPPAAVEFTKTDPLLLEMWFGTDGADAPSGGAGSRATPQAAGTAASDRCADGCAAPGGHEDRLIENAAELRHLTQLCDDVSKILRAHLAAHPVSFEEAATDEDEESKAAEFKRFDPRSVSVSRQARVLNKEFYGYPEGTRLVCANLGALHAELVRVDGRLRILTVYVLADD